MADRGQGIIPHLVVDGAIAALEFYKKALGATETMRMPAEDGKRLMHAEIIVNGARVFLMDDSSSIARSAAAARSCPRKRPAPPAC
jgi:PhnB protein